MTAQDALKSALKEIVGPVLRQHGFKGSAPTWLRVNDRGDVVVVNVQSSSFSSADKVTCIINLAAVPEPWLAWVSARDGQPPPKAVKEYHGLWRDRLRPTGWDPAGSEVWWSVLDQQTANAVAEDMVQQLVTEGLPRLEPLLQRDSFVQALRLGDLGRTKPDPRSALCDWALAVLLGDEGPSEELTAVLVQLPAGSDPRHADVVDRLVAWATDRAERAGRRAG